MAIGFIDSTIAEGNYDFLHGAVGAGVYLVERHKKTSQTENIEFIIEKLKEITIENKLGKFWPQPPFEYDNDNKLIYNLGLAHGIPSGIAFLSNVLKAGINKGGKTKDILRGLIEFILNFKESNSGYSFPSRVIDGNIFEKGRLAWCYGDLGVGVSLWQAGEALNDRKLMQEAIEICLATTKITNPDETGVVDAGLCHGASGIMHIYNRMHYNTGVEQFKEAADFWAKQTVQMARFEDGPAGFKTWNTPEYGGWQNDYGLLEGISGIGLALSSHLSEKEPTWDRFLLLS